MVKLGGTIETKVPQRTKSLQDDLNVKPNRGFEFISMKKETSETSFICL